MVSFLSRPQRTLRNIGNSKLIIFLPPLLNFLLKIIQIIMYRSNRFLVIIFSMICFFSSKRRMINKILLLIFKRIGHNFLLICIDIFTNIYTKISRLIPNISFDGNLINFSKKTGLICIRVTIDIFRSEIKKHFFLFFLLIV